MGGWREERQKKRGRERKREGEREILLSDIVPSSDLLATPLEKPGDSG